VNDVLVHRYRGPDPWLTHIVDMNASPITDDDVDVTTALCGEQALEFDVNDEARIQPPDFDYYLLGRGCDRATCKACLRRRAEAIGGRR